MQKALSFFLSITVILFHTLLMPDLESALTKQDSNNITKSPCLHPLHNSFISYKEQILQLQKGGNFKDDELPKDIKAAFVIGRFAKKTLARMKLSKKVGRSIAHESSHPEVDVKGYEFLPSELDRSGLPTDGAILKYVQQEYFDNEPTKVIACKRQATGMLSKKIYCITCNDIPVFYAKISYNFFHNDIQDFPALNLAKLQKGPLGRIGLDTFKDDAGNLIRPKDLPKMTWLEEIIAYFNPMAKTYEYIEFSHAAKGTIFDQCEKKQLDDSVIRKMIRQMLQLHKTFVEYDHTGKPSSMVLHGDLHGRNFAIDSQGRITFIDCEGMKIDKDYRYNKDFINFMEMLRLDFGIEIDSMVLKIADELHFTQQDKKACRIDESLNKCNV